MSQKGFGQAQEAASPPAQKLILKFKTQFPKGSSDLTKVERFFEKREIEINEALLEALPKTFQKLTNHPSQKEKEKIAALFGMFGIALYKVPVGNRQLNLEIFLVCQQLALKVFTRRNSAWNWAVAQNNLGEAYRSRIRGERADNLELAIAAYERALEVYTCDAFPEQWATTQNNLGNAYSDRIRGERVDNLEQAIAAYERALEVRTRDAFPEDWAMTQNNLATAYRSRIRGERADNLEMAIAAYERALEVRTRDAFPEDWAMTQNNLATAYRSRIRGERADNLEQAIAAYERALEVLTRDSFPEQWAATQNNLAIAYSNRIRGERADNLEQAIAASERALEVLTRDAFPEQWATTQNNLANAYSDRIRGERADNLELAIAAYERALEVRTRDAFPEKWATTQNNLATAYNQRIRGERADNLEQAIAASERALEVLTRDAFPEQWATTQNNLAIAYSDRIRGERADNLELAIAASERALEVLTRDAFPEKWAMTQNNLAIAYRNRIRGERADNLERAIAAYERALEVYTRDAFPKDWAATQNNLAAAYSNRIRGERTDNLERAIAAYERALEVYTRDAFPNDCRRTSRLSGNLQTELHNWDAANQSYGQALAAAENLYQACTLLDSQAAELKETADLPRRAAYAYAKADQLAKALETIERGRARGLSERLQRDRADLAQLQQQRPDLFDRYRDITNQLQDLESQQRDQRVENFRKSAQNENFLIPLTLEEHRNEAQKLRQDLTEAIAQIRQVPGYETFLQAPSLAEIQQNLSTEAPTVYLIPTPNGSLALIATPQAIDPLWLDAFPEATLTDLVQTWLNASQNQRNDFPGWLEAIDQGTRQLWDNLMAPLIDRLKQHNHTQAILIPTGWLGLLPLHAAWTPDPNHPTGRRYALDELTFTYAPNAQSLVAARAIAQRFPDSHLDSILAIDNPRQDLPSSEREVLAAVKTFPRPTVLRHEKATTATVAANLGQQAIVHFSCHGTVDFEEPLNSGLLMNDDLLTLRELFALKLTEGDKHGIRLAVLSACETGLPGLDLADEAIGLPVGLLQAGVAGAIASLWAVSDLSTAILLTKFYDLWRNHHLTPPDALCQAQQWLRSATLSEIRQLTGIGLRGAEHPLVVPVK